jgi:nucleoside-diphosphate-sugar epimerase
LLQEKSKGASAETDARLRLQTMNVLLTGATGFVGTSLTRELVEQGHNVCVIARDDKKFRASVGDACAARVKILTGDLLAADRGNLSKQLENMPGGLDVVIQTVGGGPLTSNPAFAPGIFDLNCKTTSNLIEILESSGNLQSLRLFVYFSSLAAMGLPKSTGDRVQYDETVECNPVLPYERAKREAETYLQGLSAKHGFKIAVLRYPQIYGGPGDAFLQMVGMIQSCRFPVVRGKIGSLPLVHLRDVVGSTTAVIQNVDRIPSKYEVYLVAEGSYSYSQLVDMVRAKYGRGGMLAVPYFVTYLGTAALERAFALMGKPEPLNRRRLVSLTKDRVVDCSKFVNTFQFKFAENVRTYLASQPA